MDSGISDMYQELAEKKVDLTEHSYTPGATFGEMAEDTYI